MKTIGCFFLFLASFKALFSQKKDTLDDHTMLVKIENDSIVKHGIALNEVVVFQPLKFDTRDKLRRYLVLQNRTLKVYPYAKLASERLKVLNERLEKITNKRKRKIYTKRLERFIYNEFEKELKKLSRSQGRILIKLVHRQTGKTTHQLIKELRTGWRAFIYQVTASFFKLSLKDIYDPMNNYEDFLIEDILQRASSEGRIELAPTALTFDIDSLYGIWKRSKNTSPNKKLSSRVKKKK